MIPEQLSSATAIAFRGRGTSRDTDSHSLSVSTPSFPLDFAGNPDAAALVGEGLRLAYGHQFNPVFASEISRIDFLPHQRIAVYEHMLPSEPLRFLLADDAGAGKTIMTGLVIREMLLRDRIRRVLVVPPAGLVGNWERELRTLFRLQFRIVIGADTLKGNPFAGPDNDLAIVSIDTLAGERVFGELRSPDAKAYDLVVFDEAHKLAASTQNQRTRKTRRYKLAEALAGCPTAVDSAYLGLQWSSRHLLLLTATPHMGKDSPYHHLWRLLDHRLFPTSEAYLRFPQHDRSRYFIRRTKEEMVDPEGKPLYRPRYCDTFSYSLTSGPEGEQALYDATTDYLRSIYRRGSWRGASRLVMGVFQRRLASSSFALERSFERRAQKLREAAEALRSGQLTTRELTSRCRGVERRYRVDYFDSHSADEDALEGQRREASEEFEAEVLGAVVSADIDELDSEIAMLEELAQSAREIIDSGRESKFDKLREVLEDPRYASEKWLIFTEHRDTMEYLEDRLEGLGYTGQVARIHGGMNWSEREEQVEHFRDPGGARYMVATDAAGEGINLQFCAFMANYDIPWNPARLEQRMGRIHRYGQKRDVRIVNIVAGGTREGRVLQVLLRKLEAIRRELRSDKVFDVVGRLFEDTSLRDYMVNAVSGDQSEDGVLEEVGKALDGNRVRRLGEAQERVYGKPGDVSVHLGRLRESMTRERHLKLLPGYVRLFVERSAALLRLDIEGNLNEYFRLVPRQRGGLDFLLTALERYPVEAHDRLCFERSTPDNESIWLHPGEPVFDALSEYVVHKFSEDALRGSIFTDPRTEKPYLFHLAVASACLMDEDRLEGDQTNRPEAAESVTSKRTLERKLFAVRQEKGSEAVESLVEPLLLQGARVPPGAVPLAARGLPMRAEAREHLERVANTKLIGPRRLARKAALPEEKRNLRISFDLHEADLVARRNALSGKPGDTEAAAMARLKSRQRRLFKEKELALAALEAEPDRIVLGSMEFVLHGLALPPVSEVEREQFSTSVEDIAVRAAIAWERERFATVQDVSKPVLARAAGLQSWPGFDLLSVHPDGEERNIEVKGRAGRGGIQIADNEWKAACHLKDRYWLYVVFNCLGPSPELLRIQNPFQRLLASHHGSSAYTISAKSLAAAAEPA